jgi:hypothetical protein
VFIQESGGLAVTTAPFTGSAQAVQLRSIADAIDNNSSAVTTIHNAIQAAAGGGGNLGGLLGLSSQQAGQRFAAQVSNAASVADEPNVKAAIARLKGGGIQAPDLDEQDIKFVILCLLLCF